MMDDAAAPTPTRTTLPNLLTYFRLAAVPFLILAFVQQWYLVALILFCLAGGTDLIDGYIARRFNQRSRLGAILDPIADKLLMAVSFIGLATVPGGKIIPIWFVVLVLGKDLFIIAGIGYFLWRKVPIEYGAVFWSKVTTLLLLVIGGLALIDLTFPGVAIIGYPVWDFVFWGSFIGGALLIITILEYLQRGLEILQRPR
ncbi:MAG: CDP-alcohol phosphatidyltransferase family protein [Deltaproteobacteria bacterium]|nr:CDP-alcohol phosphatidyltransferase family protein [Deltaproteobacteria bacterium]